jgi:MATE family multidrug resistance protein
MVVNIIGAVINIPLDYALINGVWGFPELGIRGAALATVVSWAVIAGLFALLIFRRRNEGFGVFSRWRFDAELFGRLMKYGGPGGVQFFIDVFGITFFIFMVGRIGNAELAATNIVLSIDTLAFLPTVGLSIAVSTLVGQAIGEGNPERAVFATHNTIHVAMLFMGLVAAAFVLLPETLMVMFRPEGMSQAEYAPIVAAGVVLLRLCALFTLCDSALITLIGALKGAGDSRFVMWTMGAASLFVLVIPSYLAVEHFGAGLYGVWGFLVAYVILLSGVCWVRFRRGRWKDMSVLEDELAPSPLN